MSAVTRMAQPVPLRVLFHGTNVSALLLLGLAATMATAQGAPPMAVVPIAVVLLLLAAGVSVTRSLRHASAKIDTILSEELDSRESDCALNPHRTDVDSRLRR